MYQLWLVRQPEDEEGKHVLPFNTWYDQLIENANQQRIMYNESTEDILNLARQIQAKVGDEYANI